MSIHDKIDLPQPAGYYYEWDGAYGKRKFTTAPHNGRECDRAVAYYTEDQVRAAIEADRKRLGEPVAWLVRDAMLAEWLFKWVEPEPGLWKYVKPLYAAPQAAEPSRGEPVAWLCEDELPDNYPYDTMFPYSKVDGVRMFPVYAPQPAEPVKVPSDSEIMWEWANTPNTGDMRVDLVVFARALLARYGKGTP